MSTHAPVEPGRAHVILGLNTLAFTVCFAAWMLNGVLVTFLVDNQVFAWTASQMGLLIGIPVLTGSITRLPLGMLTDKYGGRPVYTLLMLAAAVPMFLLGRADSYGEFLLASLGFGLTGGSFAVGIAFTSVWYSRAHQGTALGIFGAGNAGAALTTLGAPTLLGKVTAGGTNLDGWRTLPMIYAVALAMMAVIFFLATKNKRPKGAASKTVGQLLAPLTHVRVWRFGLYYFLVFGGFVALAQWLVPYYLNVYGMTIVMAGLMTSIFSFPSGVIRALGGWLSDRFGARGVFTSVLATIAACSLLLIFPKMDIESPGRGVLAVRAGTVTAVSDNAVRIDERQYAVQSRGARLADSYSESEALILPVITTWQEPIVQVGDVVAKRQLVAQGVTHIYFQANVWIFTALVFVIGIAMGIGKAAVYKYIPDYFPNDVGVVGGIVGVLGGLGGFVCPIIFGVMLDGFGLWTTTWMFLLTVSLACILWLTIVVRRLLRAAAPEFATDIEPKSPVEPLTLRVWCPVHGVEAQVRIVAASSNQARLGACSLHPEHTGGVPCEGQCIIRHGEGEEQQSEERADMGGVALPLPSAAARPRPRHPSEEVD
jgi:NNP family nitrate/nitrite transporter-like MFS transporter